MILFVLLQLQCCGANSPSDWHTSKYNKGDNKQAINLGVTSQLTLYKLPASCCTRPEGSEECNNLKTGIATPVNENAYSQVQYS